jgi:hypothetical protein
MGFNCILTISQDVPVLCIEVHLIKLEDDAAALTLSSACLDGKLHHWLIPVGVRNSLAQAQGLGQQMTFESSFLPIMMYQNFLQLIMDRRENQ